MVGLRVLLRAPSAPEASCYHGIYHMTVNSLTTACLLQYNVSCSVVRAEHYSPTFAVLSPVPVHSGHLINASFDLNLAVRQ